MLWLYHTQKKWQTDDTAPAQKVLFRAVGKETEDGRMVSDIIEMNVFAMDFYFNLEENPMKDDKYQRIYYKELEDKDYFFEEMSIRENEKEYMMHRVALYLKGEQFSKNELLEWMKTYTSIHGLECTNWEETDIMSFYETNPILSMFSMSNAKKFEDKLGKDWWKNDDTK